VPTVQHIVYLFDRFQLDVTRRKLLSSGGLVLPLGSRPLEALLLLVANAGQIVDRRRLMQTVWPDRIVEDNNLNQCVLAIRKALGETAGSNHYVMTVPGRGFSFVCPVRVQTQESADEMEAAAPVPPAPAAPVTVATSPVLSFADQRVSALASSRSFWLGVALGSALVAAVLLPFALH
jgi:DNA-binding winged helix-turn-helix (wHTH) protein